jgi:WW domain-containing oxidoreductase
VRRLGIHGVTSCVADPGAVRTNIYSHSPKLSQGLAAWFVNNCYAPPEDGAQVRGGAGRTGQ